MILPLLLAFQAAILSAPVDTSQLASKADVSAAVSAATPPDCTAPLSDALTATAGVQPRCMPRPDAQRATLVQATTVTTAADGTFSGNWPAPFLTAPTGRSATIELSSTAGAPFTCGFIAGSVTNSSFAGRCFQIVATTLPTTLTALQGLAVSPLANAAGGLTVRVVGRQ